MSVNVIAELHPLRPTRARLAADPKPVADIIGGLNSGFPLSHARACLNGEIVRDFSTVAHDGDTLWVKFVPYGDGGGMKVGGWALAAVGLIVGAATSWTGIGLSVGVALIGSGIGMAVGGTVLLNMNVPSLKDREKPEQDPSLRGGKNQARPHGRIPVLFGRRRVYPDLAANPFTSIIEGEQHYTQLFCGGYRDCAIDLSTLRLGDTPLVEFSQTKDIGKIVSGQDSVIRMEILQDGRPPALYPRCVNDQMVNAALKNRTDGGDSGAVVRNTPGGTTEINVDIFFYNGLGRYNDDGSLGEASVEVAAYWKPANAPDSGYQSLGPFAPGTGNTITGNELRTMRLQATKPGLAPGEYTVKVERVTADSTDPKVVDAVYVGSVRSYKAAPPVRPERQGGLTLIALRAKATDQLNGVVDSLNYVATSLLPSYSGTGHTGPTQWLEASPTRNPAAMLLYALGGRAAQQGVDDGDIDWPALERFHDWCGAHEYYCDAYLSEAVPISALFGMIGSTARAEVLRLDSKISVVQDIARGGPAQLFTPKNTIGYSTAMLMADVPDALLLRFVDETGGAYAENSLTVYDTPDGNRAEEPETTQTVDLWGVTGSAQARRIGMYSYGVMRHRPFVHTVEVDIEYLLCGKGDWVQYAGDLALAGSTQGRVRETIADNGRCTGFIADEPIEMEAGRAYGVRVRKQDGTVMLENVRANAAARNGVEFLTPMPLASAPAAGDIYAFGVRGEEAIDLIITDVQPQANLSATLTCVEYSPEIFGVDGPGFVLPEFRNRLSPVQGAIDGGLVSEWGLHETFHDGGAEPAMPTGDGQGGGWHRARTAASAWASSKRSASPASGAWGPPVRLKGADGRDGIGISSISYKYRRTSAPAAPTAGWADSGWSTAVPSLDPTNKWLWFIERIAYTDGTNKDTVGPQAVHGDTGAAGNGISSISYKYRRTSTSAAPTAAWGDSGWSTAVPSLDPTNKWLWFIERIAYTDGTNKDTVGPQAVYGDTGAAGKDGLGIDAIPRDPWAYWPCDDLPGVPDDPAGVTGGKAFGYKNAPANMLGMAAYLATLSLDGGSIKSTPSSTQPPNWQLTGTEYNGRLLVARVRFSDAVAVPSIEYGEKDRFRPMKVLQKYSDREYLVYDVLELASRNLVWFRGGNGAVTGWLDQLYVGDGSYLPTTPLLDGSGGGRHMRITRGVLPAQGPGGRPALQFLGTGGALTKWPDVTFCPDGDFTWALWVNRDNAASAASQYIIGNWESGGGGIYAHVGGSLGAKFYSNGAFLDILVPAAKAPNNTWLHVILKYYGGTRTLAMKIDNVEERRLALPAPIGWPSKAVPLALGGDPAASQTSLSARYYGLLADVAVFDKLTTEEEDEALYKTSLTKRYGLADWLLDPANSQSAMARYTPRYRGAAAVADTGNTGTIATNQGVVGANPGDWVMFTGRAGWQYAMVYEWTGSAWRQLPRPDNAFKYLDGVSDLADGVPDGVFADVFCRALWAQQAFIDQLRTYKIELESPGEIRSKGFSSGTSGFRIRHDGEAEFNNGIFRGIIEALGGIFNGTLVIGKLWDKNGNIVNSKARGSLLALNNELIDENREIRIKDLITYGNTWLGSQIGTADHDIIFLGNRKVVRGTSTEIPLEMHLRGNYTAQNLCNAIENNFGSSPVYNYVNPLSGSVVYYTEGQGGGNSYSVSVSCLKKNNSNDYWIYGLSTGGTRIIMLVSSTKISIGNEDTNKEIIAVTGSKHITVDFVFF